METPLLASHPDNQEPSLLSFWPAEDETGPSQFAQLLEQRAPSLLHWRLTTVPHHSKENPELEGSKEWYTGYWLLIGSGTASWSATFLSIETPFVTTSIPLLNNNLTDILAQFQNVILLWISALAIPCLFMVSAPALILRDSHRPRNWNWKKKYCTSPRSLMECTIRGALFLFYFLIVLQLAVDSVHLDWTGSSIAVHSQAEGGLVAYVAGVASALLAVVFWRWPPPPSSHTFTMTNSEIRQAPIESETHEFVPVLNPIAAEETPAMVVLEDTSTLEDAAVRFQPVIRDESERNNHELPLPANVSWYQKLLLHAAHFRQSVFCKSVLVYQVGLFSCILWIPAYTLPLIQWSTLHFSPGQTHQLILWNLPQLLGQSGAASGTAYWIIGLLGVVLMTSVFVAPAIALFLSIAIWCLDPKYSRQCQSWLYLLHPLMGQAVWCMALLCVTPALEPWSRQLLVDHTNICQALQTWVTTDECFLLQADFQPGILLLAVQTVSVELFVILSLRWSI